MLSFAENECMQLINADLPPYDDVPFNIIQFDDDEMGSPKVAPSSSPNSALVPHVEGVSPSNVLDVQLASGERQPNVWKHYHPHAKDATPSGTANGIAEKSAPKWARLTLQDANVQPTLRRIRTATNNAYQQVNYALMAFVMEAELEPQKFGDGKGHSAWQKAMESEIRSIEKNATWDLVDKPIGKNIVGTKWIYKIK